MKLLILGKNGQVGRALPAALARLGDVVAVGRDEADFERAGELAAIVAQHSPDVIVNAAAYTAVDRAEAEPSRARRINGEAVAELADAAVRRDALLIHYSTDYVFDGSKYGPYSEEDKPNPLSIYGATKLEGEQGIAQSDCQYLLLRVSWVFGPGGGNFLRTILRLARQRESLDVVGDQIGAPTSASEIAIATAAAIEAARRQGDLLGLYHFAAAGTVSRAELARFLVTEAQRLGAVLRLEPQAINSVATADYPTPAQRPLNSTFDTAKLRKVLGIEPRAWQMPVREWLTATIGGNDW